MKMLTCLKVACSFSDVMRSATKWIAKIKVLTILHTQIDSSRNDGLWYSSINTVKNEVQHCWYRSATTM
jgi:hypothetical protein